MPALTHPYDRHVGRYGEQLAAGLITLAGVTRGNRALDVGCGTGQLTLRLAEVVGGENVSALDPSPAMLRVCGERAPSANIVTGSAEELPYPDDYFDAVLSQLAINLVHDQRRALAEMVRVARPGSSIVACVWDNKEMPLLRAIWGAVGAIAPEAVEGVSDRTQVGLKDPTVLAEWWEAAGLAEVRLGQYGVRARYFDFDDLWLPLEEGVGHSGRVYRSLNPRLREEARTYAHQSLGSPLGTFELVAKVRSVRGVVPVP